MIQPVLILLGLAILGMIYFHRYSVLAQGTSPFAFIKKRQRNLFHFSAFRDGKEPAEVEITVDEMIPAVETVDVRSQNKADFLRKKANASLEKCATLDGEARAEEMRNAEKLFIQALSLDPSHQDCYQKLGLIYLQNNQFGKAELMYRKLMMSGFQNAIVLERLGSALALQQKWNDAKTFFQKALECPEPRADVFFQLGTVHQELSEFEEALQHFQKAVDLHPKNPIYLLTLISFYIDLAMEEEAKKTLERMLTVHPNHPEAMQMLENLAKKVSSSTPASE